MKNKFLLIFITIFLSTKLFAENIFIEAKNISLDKEKEISIFRNDVTVKTIDKKITSQYAEYNKVIQEIILKDKIIAEDKFGNIIKADYAEYNNLEKMYKTVGPTTLITSEDYSLKGSDIFFDNNNKIIRSDKKSILQDISGNKIFLENFEYLANENIFKSVGYVKVIDHLQNKYEFSQIYIDTKKRELLGTDIKAFLNHQDFKVNNKNDPRIFANTMRLNDLGSSFNKSVFTLCEFKENEKCPPWTLQASKMTHDNKSKTIYYDNAVIKIYDVPIFYLPFLSHPDPSVERRSGLLPPTFSDSKNLGSGIAIPYFWDLGKDKNFTVTSRLFVDENPLFIGEYHQAFKNSNFLTDFGYTEGYKKTSRSKKAGSKSHFFTKFTKNFKGKSNSDNSLSLIAQNISDDKYLKLYKIESNLVDYNKDTLENSIDFKHTEKDLFFGFNASMYETLKDDYNDKYEYIFPEITIDKNILSSDKFGNLDLQTNLEVHNYDTNKHTNFFVNDFEWDSNDIILNSKVKNRFLGKLKNINYEAKNVDVYKKDTTHELFGAIGLISEINFKKKEAFATHLLTPKLLLKLSPGQMRKETSGSRLTPINAFNLDRLNTINNFETGNTATLGFDYDIKKKDIDKFNFSVAQIINEKENKKLAQKSSLDEKISDLVGSANLYINEKIRFSHNFAIDQNYQELNYNDFGSNIEFGNMNIGFNYIEEDKHIGSQEYFKSKINYNNKDKSLVSFETKRNLVTNSSEFYDLSYEYINDCLRAGLVYRREFYNDSELEAENSLMFNITLTPFGSINSPKVNR
tara:strand:- start:7179 stop:9578 length:2400 start_codon:yes stop_codon:yes gene_type:complete